MDKIEITREHNLDKATANEELSGTFLESILMSSRIEYFFPRMISQVRIITRIILRASPIRLRER